LQTARIFPSLEGLNNSVVQSTAKLRPGVEHTPG